MKHRLDARIEFDPSNQTFKLTALRRRHGENGPPDEDEVLHDLPCRLHDILGELAMQLRALGEEARKYGKPAAVLTPRETECLGWYAAGKSYWEIAVILGVRERTVSFHMDSIRRKLEASSNAHAVAIALQRALLPDFRATA